MALGAGRVSSHVIRPCRTLAGGFRRVGAGEPVAEVVEFLALDHIPPAALVPVLAARLFNLEAMPAKENPGKSARTGRREVEIARRWHREGLAMASFYSKSKHRITSNRFAERRREDASFSRYGTPMMDGARTTPLSFSFVPWSLDSRFHESSNRVTMQSRKTAGGCRS